MAQSDRQSSIPTIDFQQFAGKTLDLELSRTARAFKPEERIWAPELRRIFGLIRDHTISLKRWQQGSDHGEEARLESAPLLSIAIFGTYGSGKSSLLKTFVREARSRERKGDSEIPHLDELQKLMYSLPVLEPNILSKDDHFLYSFLATALEEDLKKHREGEERLAAGSHNLSPVQQAFQRVSEFLQVIDPPPGRQEYDPLGLSLERLDRHTSGFRLREELHGLIESLAHNLAGTRGDSVLILPVDDADMSLDKLTATLDTYRRYLLHPRLVPIFTFTGHLAEELLQVNFAEDLSYEKRQRITQRTSKVHSLDITEHLAYQYLVKLFPIRNRIKLGYAPARVQAGKIISRQGQDVRVLDVLEISSILLFGAPKYPIAPRVRKALRPATLRRQLQVIDAMYECGVQDFLGKEEKRGSMRVVPVRTSMRSWTEIFGRAAWSLLNVHRDVLRELGVHLESLYGWTPRNLRREVLRILLAQNRVIRRTILRRWRYRVEGRRNQMLSLLALLAFRPHLPGEEASGDDPDQIHSLFDETADSTDSEKLLLEKPQHISVPTAFSWFLDLWIGFYLPQILARKRPSANEAADSPQLVEHTGRPVHAIGWSLRTGPLHVISLLNQRGEDFKNVTPGPGMVRLNPESLFETLRSLKVDLEAQEETDERMAELVTLLVWSVYGPTDKNEEGSWAALSFWRGLGLIGQIWNVYRSSLGSDQEIEGKRSSVEQQIRKVLQEHVRWALRPGPGDQAESIPSFSTGDFDGQCLNALADDLCTWLEGFRDQYVDLLAIDELSSVALTNAWDSSLLARLHGEHVLGAFWPRLGSATTGIQEIDGAKILTAWARVLENYFKAINCVPTRSDDAESEAHLPRKLSTFFRTCPLLFPWFKHRNDLEALSKSLEPNLKDLSKSVGQLKNQMGSQEKKGQDEALRQELDEKQTELSRKSEEWSRCWPKVGLTFYSVEPPTGLKSGKSYEEPATVTAIRAEFANLKLAST